MPSRGDQQGAFLAPDHLTITYGDASARIARGTGADWFGPLDPLKPIAPPEVASRQWDFPSGFNLNATPRVDAQITFETLRGLADAYDLLRLIIETRKDQIARMRWSIKPRDETATNANDPALRALSAFFKRPDGVHGFSDWLRLFLEDLFVIDAPALYLQRDRAGRLIALLPLDGATIKPVIDDWGRTPQPFAQDGALVYPTAYQQILKGYPALDYSTRDLLYRPRNIRSHCAYGYSPVEQIITTVGIALRRQISTLEYYTSGNIPDSLIGVPETWTPDQIANYQKYWDAYIEGDLGRRRKAKFVPGGVAKTFIQTKEPELKSEFDDWLARLCCFAFSVSPQALVKQMNRASADTQKELAEEEGLWPILDWVKTLIDDVIEREFGAPQFEFAWGQDRQIDAAQQATVLSTYVKAGVLTINEARQKLGEKPLADPAANRAMTLTASGYQPIGAGAQGNAAENGAFDTHNALKRQSLNRVIDLLGLDPRTAPVIHADPPHNPFEDRRNEPQHIRVRTIAKFNPYHLPGGPGGGQFTSAENAAGDAALNHDVYRPGADGKPKLTPVQEEDPREESEFEHTPEEIAALAASRAKVQDILRRVQALDLDWRPPDQLVGLDASGQPILADQLANDRALIAAAEVRLNEFRHQRIDFPGQPALDLSNLEAKANYALNPANPRAAWFKEVLGFDRSNWKFMVGQIYFDLSIAEPRDVQPEGPTYQQVLSIRGPNGNIANVRFGFIRSWSNVVRVTTIMPGR